jgi:hypothetical protein
MDWTLVNSGSSISAYRWITVCMPDAVYFLDTVLHLCWWVLGLLTKTGGELDVVSAGEQLLLSCKAGRSD